jgi:hypothetical protein
MRSGAVAVAEDVFLYHLQRWRVPEALMVHFHSGRSYGASVRLWPANASRVWWRALPSIPRALYQRTLPVLLRGAAGERAWGLDRFWLGLLVFANVAGQFVGALGGAGSSRQWLR